MSAGLTRGEVIRVVNRYIGVEGGYLGDLSYWTHAEFYPEYCELDIDPNEYEGTTWERFIEILSSSRPERQARILRGLLKSQAGDIELRGLSWAERRRAVRESMYVDDADLDGLVVLVVDDVITSGATLREAGRLLKQNGVAVALGAALTHTEG